MVFQPTEPSHSPASGPIDVVNEPTTVMTSVNQNTALDFSLKTLTSTTSATIDRHKLLAGILRPQTVCS